LVYFLYYYVIDAFTMKKTVFSSVLTLMLIVSPVSAADTAAVLQDPGTLPGSPFYFLDRFMEQIGVLLTVDKVARIERKIALAEERLAEARSLAEGGKHEAADKTLGEYETDIADSITDAKTVKKEGGDATKIDEVLAKLAEESVRHQAALAEVYAKVPEAAREAIKHAMEMSAEGHARAIQAVSKDKRDEVRDRVKKENEEDREHLDALRESGVPVPEFDDDEDVMDVEDELDALEDDINSASDEAEDLSDESSSGRGVPESAGRR
jgi:hypothetical protein